MTAPRRKEKPQGYHSAWSTAWRELRGGWPHLVRVVSGFDPLRERAIKRSCSYADIARSYKSMIAADGDFTWNN